MFFVLAMLPLLVGAYVARDEVLVVFHDEYNRVFTHQPTFYLSVMLEVPWMFLVVFLADRIIGFKEKDADNAKS